MNNEPSAGATPADGASALGHASEVFEQERPRLLGLAYRLLGSLSDADDVVQETWLRWARTDRAVIERPAAWLTTVCSRIGLDHLRARQRDRVEYVGPWLPEPITGRVAGGGPADPAEVLELSDSLTTSFLVLLERLGPEERLALLLADVFGEPFAAVAAVTGRSEVACRQLASRARRKLRDGARFAPTDTPASARDVARQLAAAVLAGDVDAVRRLLSPDVVLLSDGGAATHAARRPVVTPERVARFLVNVTRRPTAWLPEITLEETTLNGSPGFLARDPDGVPVLGQAIDVVDGLVVRIHITANRAKLTSVDRSVTLW